MSDTTTTAREIHWNHRLEEYFAQTGEKCHCLAWLHKQAEDMYSRRTIWIDLPVIVLGTLNGAVSVGSATLFGASDMSSVGVGIVALTTAILSTIGSYFAWARRAEAHKISSLNYSKLYRFLSVEMALPRKERLSPTELLKYVKTEYDRLSEISPLVPSTILDRFRQRFSNIKDITFPEETNGLHPIIIYHEQNTTTPLSSAFVPTLHPQVVQNPSLMIRIPSNNVDGTSSNERVELSPPRVTAENNES